MKMKKVINNLFIIFVFLFGLSLIPINKVDADSFFLPLVHPNGEDYTYFTAAVNVSGNTVTVSTSVDYTSYGGTMYVLANTDTNPTYQWVIGYTDVSYYPSGATSFNVATPGNHNVSLNISLYGDNYWDLPFYITPPPVSSCSVSPNPGVDSSGNIVNITVGSSNASWCSLKVDEYTYWSNYNTSGTLSLTRGAIGASVGSHQAKVSCMNAGGVSSPWVACDYSVINAPVDGGWSGWSAQDNTCAYSAQTKTQTRSCNSPTPAYGGAGCSGPSTQTYTVPACASNITSLYVSPNVIPYGGSANIYYACTNGYYSHLIMDDVWSPVNDSGYYGSRSPSTTGSLTTPGTHYIMAYCYNSDWVPSANSWSRIGTFTVSPPIINGGWSGWSAQNPACGYSGTQTRSCDSPAPSGGGAACSGSSTQAYTNAPCPINGGWSGWSAQDNTCAYSAQTKTQTRSCNSPTPAYGGAACSGPSTQTYNVPACASNITSLSVTPNVPYGSPATISYSCSNGYYSHLLLDWNWTSGGGWDYSSVYNSGTYNTPALTSVGSHTMSAYCYNSDWVPSANSWTSVSFNVNNAAVPTPDLKVTAWGSNNADGSVETYVGSPVTLSWAAVANATSCTINGSAVSVSGGSQAGAASALSQTYTLACTNATGQSASDAVTVTIPPPPTSFTSSCNAAGNLVTLNWAVPAPYTGGYVRPTAPFYVDVASGTTTSVAITPGQTYSGLYVHTRASNGAWSNIKTLPDFTCNPPASGPITATNCSIALGASSCNTNLIWSTTYPIGTSQVTTPTSIVVANANSSAGTSYAVSNGTRNFFLYNNGTLLSTATATASCTAGTHWGGATCISDNNAPLAPTISGNATFYKDVLQNFIVTGTDPDLDQVRYGVDWNNDGVADVWTGFVASGTSMVPANSWPTPGVYSLKALTQDIKGANSAWSSLFTVTVTNPPVPASISSFSVNTNKIEFGEAVNVAWTSTGATTCSMVSVPSPSVSIVGVTPIGNNNKTFKPLKTTIYTLTCNGPGGNDSKSVTVTVGKLKPVIKEI